MGQSPACRLPHHREHTGQPGRAPTPEASEDTAASCTWGEEPGQDLEGAVSSTLRPVAEVARKPEPVSKSLQQVIGLEGSRVLASAQPGPEAELAASQVLWPLYKPLGPTFSGQGTSCMFSLPKEGYRVTPQGQAAGYSERGSEPGGSVRLC